MTYGTLIFIVINGAKVDNAKITYATTDYNKACSVAERLLTLYPHDYTNIIEIDDGKVPERYKSELKGIINA